MLDVARVFYYDESSPSGLRWSTNRFRGPKYSQLFIRAGDAVGHRDGDNYWRVKIEGRTLACHRLVYILHFGAIPEDMEVDHEDGNRGNNKITNLRLVTGKINARNARKFKSNTSGATGVSRTVCKNSRGTGAVNVYWVAEWIELDGAVARKRFSATALGEEAAFDLAREYRARMIEELNAAGAGYTARHGTDN